jgi:hypothetical protein
MLTSKTITKIIPAFLEAQKKIESVVKSEVNSYFNSKYAGLKDVVDACKDKLNSVGIIVLQPIVGMTVETVLIHESGEYFSSSTPIVTKITKTVREDIKTGIKTTSETVSDPQALGSAISYARRQGLQSMVLIPAADDDGSYKPVVNAIKPSSQSREHFCEMHKTQMKDRGNGIWDHRHQDEKTQLWEWCQGQGYKTSTVQKLPVSG